MVLVSEPVCVGLLLGWSMWFLMWCGMVVSGWWFWGGLVVILVFVGFWCSGTLLVWFGLLLGDFAIWWVVGLVL